MAAQHLFCMVLRSATVGVVAFLGALGCVNALAADNPPLKDLQNDASRAQLFQRVVKAAVAELKRQEPNAPGARYLPGDFVFPRDAVNDFKLGVPRKDSVFGIDISHYTGKLDFAWLKGQHVAYVYAKATQGNQFKDAKFAQFWSTLGQLPTDKKVRRGAYHFLSAGIDGEAQATKFVNFVKANGGFNKTDKDEMPPVVDLEWDVTRSGGPDAWRKYDADYIIQQTLAWLKYVEKETGRIPVVYTARSWWRERHIPEARFAELVPYRIWIADYSRSGKATEAPGVPANAQWHLWQYSDRAKLGKGYAGGLDANIFKGTEAEFVGFVSK